MTTRLQIVGLVQGVGYRAAFATQARALALSGWVRNRRDGSVEASVAGPAAAVQQIIAWAGQGPAGAQVRSVTVTEVAASECDHGVATDDEFRILPSA